MKKPLSAKRKTKFQAFLERQKEYDLPENVEKRKNEAARLKIRYKQEYLQMKTNPLDPWNWDLLSLPDKVEALRDKLEGILYYERENCS